MVEASDIILNDDGSLTLRGSVQISGSSELVTTGPGAGYAFSDRFLAGQHWTWYAGNGKAYLTNNGGPSHLTVQPDGNVGIGTAEPQRPLHVEGAGEVHTSGAGCGFSFSDRANTGFVETPSKGERWVWYADKGEARLWSGKDQLQILADGTLVVQGGFYAAGTIGLPGNIDGGEVTTTEANNYITSIKAVHTPTNPSGVTVIGKGRDVQVDLVRVLSHLLVYSVKLEGEINTLNAAVIELQSEVKELKNEPAKLPVPGKT